ncbi:protein LYK2 [Pyrus ussuriensis x Pyrus communis]|uniref:Protein LYK2 n=1 Tax=Pyrus ussuriensis x Pyrus communis TaxID=2448454 RepID=A0A5N5GF14_9ROSA|nr:protein LYK2 [Pyrus ussuriensis x Pyrus communis]
MAAAAASSSSFLFFFSLLTVSAFEQKPHNILSCKSTSPDASGYYCNVANASSVENKCAAFAILRTNAYYSSLSNLSACLWPQSFLPKDELLFIPIDCNCGSGGVFRAELTKTSSVKGESFYGIAESLAGLTTCRAIRENNPGVSPWGLADKLQLVIPLRCACPSSCQLVKQSRLLISYPVSEGETIFDLAVKSFESFRPESLTPITSLLIPLERKPILGPLAKPREPNLRFPATGIPAISPHKKKAKMDQIGLYVALSGAIVGASIAIAAAFLLLKMKRKKKTSPKGCDVELQQLSLSVRTSDKKVSFEGFQDTSDGQIVETTTPRKALMEMYTIEELRRATEDFSSSNHIEGSVYHGRLSGKNLAVKRTQPDSISKIEFGLFHGAIHHHPNIMRLLGTCLRPEGEESLLVFEYAKNGSLKDWLHGGLAIKNQFIASCYCFLTWSQRLRISLDVAMALQYMHHIMNPPYVHRNVKSRNIFLDEEFNAKIGNFGMAKCAENEAEDQSFGYMAPEYLQQGVISPSIDIFAYGVVLLEVLCGQTPISRPGAKGEGNFYLSEKIKSVLKSDNAEELREWMDSALGDNYSFDAAVTLANLARACVDEDPSLRPSAGEVVEKLSRLVEESKSVEGENIFISESSCKPLVKAAAAANNK